MNRPAKLVQVLLLSLAIVSGAAASRAGTPQHAPTNLHCPGDKVVWVNTRSGIYHFRGERYFGSTLNGKFICEREADREGDRPTRNGQ
jgi:hypothetical protein